MWSTGAQVREGCTTGTWSACLLNNTFDCLCMNAPQGFHSRCRKSKPLRRASNKRSPFCLCTFVGTPAPRKHQIRGQLRTWPHKRHLRTLRSMIQRVKVSLVLKLPSSSLVRRSMSRWSWHRRTEVGNILCSLTWILWTWSCCSLLSQHTHPEKDPDENNVPWTVNSILQKYLPGTWFHFLGQE